jgi:hypothetical protein
MSRAVFPSQPVLATSNGQDVPRDNAYQAYCLLWLGFIAAPIIAGVDKFFHLLVNWDSYLAPVVNRALGGHGHGFMLAAGVVEVIAGIGVAIWPRVFAYVVAAWLLGIIANLLLFPPSHPFPHYDVALRDFGLFLGALALARLAADSRVSQKRRVV